jgi:hypothetical protein
VPFRAPPVAQTSGRSDSIEIGMERATCPSLRATSLQARKGPLGLAVCVVQGCAVRRQVAAEKGQVGRSVPGQLHRSGLVRSHPECCLGLPALRIENPRYSRLKVCAAGERARSGRSAAFMPLQLWKQPAKRQPDNDPSPALAFATGVPIAEATLPGSAGVSSATGSAKTNPVGLWI